jgi:hypothetical protein
MSVVVVFLDHGSDHVKAQCPNCPNESKHFAPFSQVHRKCKACKTGYTLDIIRVPHEEQLLDAEGPEVIDLTAEPVVEPAAGPVVEEPAAEPVVEPAAEPVVEEPPEPAVEPAVEPVTRRVRLMAVGGVVQLGDYRVDPSWTVTEVELFTGYTLHDHFGRPLGPDSTLSEYLRSTIICRTE